MLVHTEVSAFHDWAPCPEGTKVTQADVSALRVKQMSDGSWHMKIVRAEHSTNDANIPEAAIIDRMVSLEKLGRSQSREQTIAEILTSVYRHHLDTKSIIGITTHDDGPNLQMFTDAAVLLGLSDSEISNALETYADGVDVEAYLNVVFKTKKTGKKS